MNYQNQQHVCQVGGCLYHSKAYNMSRHLQRVHNAKPDYKFKQLLPPSSVPVLTYVADPGKP